jgi:hypothetical protein
MRVSIWYMAGTRLNSSAATALFMTMAMFFATENALGNTDAASIQRLIEIGEYSKAASAVDEVSNAEESFELQFLKGLAWQQIAESSSPGSEQRNAAFANAKHAYERAAQLRPQSSATLNNLGALNASAGRDQDARRYYSSAIEMAQKADDPKAAGYALNFSRYLEDKDGAEALRLAKLASDVPEPSIAAREQIARLYGKHDPAQLLPYAVTLLKDGLTEQVKTLSVAGARDVTLVENARREWLKLLALALAQDAKSSITFDAAPVLGQLRAIPQTDPVSPGAKELDVAVNAPPGYESRLVWWNLASPGQPTGTSSRVAMRTLLTALGDRYSAGKSPDRELAARYYGTAIPLGDRGPDPEAFLSLVNIYADSGNQPALHALMSRFEDRLFSEKGDAYQSGDWSLIYRLHVALGMTYAHLGVWDSPTPYQNATFQLEAAQRASDRLNAASQASANPARYSLPPAAASKLAQGYMLKGRPDLATKVRIDSAEALQKANRTSESAKVLRSIQASELPGASPETQAKYQRLSSVVPGAAVPVPTLPGHGIVVVGATYGGNCGAQRGNVTDHLASSCNGRDTCSYRVDYEVLGDPVSGCVKDYEANWRCGDNPTVRNTRTTAQQGEAGFGVVVSLSCAAGFAPAAAYAAINLALNKPAQESSSSEWSRPNDAQGAVDGVKNGGYGFHTAQEASPWWQVDLQQEYRLREIRIFNRGDCCPERARTIRVLLSADGMNFSPAYNHDGSTFTGTPLVVPLDGRTARFVRLQLAENAWFHLDEVEVYGD